LQEYWWKVLDVVHQCIPHNIVGKCAVSRCHWCVYYITIKLIQKIKCVLSLGKQYTRSNIYSTKSNTVRKKNPTFYTIKGYFGFIFTHLILLSFSFNNNNKENSHLLECFIHFYNRMLNFHHLVKTSKTNIIADYMRKIKG
jgi:hypothetical protein